MSLGDKVLYDSGFISEYLDRLFAGQTRLFPDDAYERAQVRMWLTFDASMQSEFKPLFYLGIIRPKLMGQGLTEANLNGMLCQTAVTLIYIHVYLSI